MKFAYEYRTPDNARHADVIDAPDREACAEGWAPAPTNEFQQAIWDKVHAAPTKPIVIKPETKKQQ